MATTEAQVRAYLEPEEPNYKAAAAALGAEALPVLETLVQGADPLLASKAAYLASLVPDERAARVLEQASRSEHATVRVAAAAGLQKLADLDDPQIERRFQETRDVTFGLTHSSDARAPAIPCSTCHRLSRA